MDYSIKLLENWGALDTDCLIAGFYHKRKLGTSAAQLDEKLSGLLSRILKRDSVEGKIGDTLLINHLPDEQIQRILLVGLGKKEELNRTSYRKLLGEAIHALKASHARQAVSTLHEIDVPDACISWKIRQTIEIFEAGNYRFDQLKTTPENTSPENRLSKIRLLVSGIKDEAAAAKGIKQGEAIAAGMKLAKDLSNLPGNICTPAYLAEQAQKVGKGHKKLKVKILDEADIEQLGMGSFLSVSRGSRQPPRLIVMEYYGAADKTGPHVLIGKGLTFDAGGISIKPSANMDEMKYDMCGGASVIGALAVAAELELPLNVIGLVPSSENLPDGNANKPGDIVTSLSGLTIEILNTDAEGRLLLCDVLTYAKRYEPAAVIDVATLTGACIVALGRHPSGIMGNDDDLCRQLTEAGEHACDRVWRLPIWEEYQEQLKSNFADLANIGGPDGGTITAGRFLSNFAKEFKWAHVDIAGTAWKTGKEKGATGRPVPLLSQYLIDQVE
ncbi:leucyl aminopeptidase [Candidatus Methylospira mobilis]|uniref:leucyl aminopeptidase n=1 Tax=Candidatus Methylospira mobilis TaxID=1808979 RepID=UPI0028E1F776|nr:leucyl aminopeptidase [Candidatus Methylospira mobilis]WNV03831.1 leucyl aminopeptidase [Candidatus Methylospira mobilis]